MKIVLNKWTLVVVVLCGLSSNVVAKVRWGSQTSSLKILSGASFNVTSSNFEVDGTLEKITGGLLTGNPITFNDAVFTSEGTDRDFTGVLNGVSNKIFLLGNHLLRCKPGSTVENLEIVGTNNKIEGQPLFSNPIVLRNNTSAVAVSLQSKLNKNIVMNGGALQLEDDLRLADEIQLTGSGFVSLNKKQLHFAGVDSTWTSSIHFQVGGDLILHSNLSLRGTWTFSGNSKIEGDDYFFDISSGGKLWVQDNTVLRLSNMIFKGLGTGGIIFETKTSQVFFENVTLVLDGNVTITQGGFYVGGALSILSNDNHLTFAQNGSFTVDNVFVPYHVGVFNPINQLLPLAINDPNKINFTSLNGGIVEITQKSGQIAYSDFHFTATLLNETTVNLTTTNRLIITDDTVYDGVYNSIQFSGTDAPLIIVNPGKALVIARTVLRNFKPGHISLGAGSHFFFGDDNIIQLDSDITTSFELVFAGNNIIQGAGNSLNLTTSSIYIYPGRTLSIRNLDVVGISDNHLRFGGIDATLALENSSLALAGNITMTTGIVRVNKESTMILGNFNWTFTNQSRLMVDGSTLWVDPLNNEVYPPVGQIYAPATIFPTRDQRTFNASINRAASNLSFINSGSVKVVSDYRVISFAANLDASTQALVSGSVTGSISLGQGLTLAPDQAINVTDNTAIDGQGGNVVFSNSDQPQVVVPNGKALSVENAVLTNINNNTFSLAPTSSLKIGGSVTFEVNEDVKMSSGTLVVTGSAETFAIRSLNGIPRTIAFEKGSTLDLGSNTLVLESVHLTGLANIKQSEAIVNGQSVVGAIALTGNSLIEVDVSTPLNFVIEGLNNEFRFQRNDVRFAGRIVYSDKPAQHELHISMPFPKISNDILQLTLSSNNFKLSSLNGRASLFLDTKTNFINTAQDSFAIGIHGNLHGKYLGVFGFPLQQTSNLITLDADMILVGDQPNVIDNSFIVRGPSSFDEAPTTAFQLQRQREHDQRKESQQKVTAQAVSNIGSWSAAPAPVAQIIEKRPQVQSAGKITNVVRPQFRNFELNEFEDQLPMTRSLAEPTIYDITYTSILNLGRALGFIRLDGAQALNFNVHPSIPLTLSMKNKSIIRQGADDIIIKPTDVINIIGKDNLIEITHTFTLFGALRFEPGASLVVQFNDQASNPVLELASLDAILLEPGVTLEFRGRGMVRCADGSQITLGGASAGFSLPLLSIKDEVVFTIARNAISTIAGSGRVYITTNGSIDLNAPSSLLFGRNKSDSIDLVVRGGSVIADLGEDIPDQNCFISFVRGTYSLDVTSGGIVSIGDGGVLELNALNGVSSNDAAIKSIKLTPGGLFRIDGAGQLVIGENKRDDLNKPSTEITYAWDSLAGQIYGQGLVSFVSQSSGSPVFAGKLNATKNEVFFRTKHTKSEDLVRNLVQQQPTLLVSTLLTDGDGNRVIRTSTGVQIVLDPNETVSSDDSAGNISVFDSQTRQFKTLNSLGQ